MNNQGKLIMGEDRAEEIRELHRKMRVWLAHTHNCPLCNDEAWWDDEDEDLGEDLEPDPACELCEGLGKVTGQQIEDWAIGHSDRSLLPSWWPRVVYVEGRA